MVRRPRISFELSWADGDAIMALTGTGAIEGLLKHRKSQVVANRQKNGNDILVCN